MIQVVIGPYRSGKTGRLLRELVDYKREHPLDDALILVPSHRYGRLVRAQLNGLLHEQASAGLFAVRIATIYEACQQVLRGAGEVFTVLPRDLCVKAVAESLSRMERAGQLNHLKTIAAFGGTAKSLYRLIEEFERAALSPHQLWSTLESTAADSARHKELALVYRHYMQCLDELKSCDQKSLIMNARELLARKQVPGLYLRWLLVDGFDRLSPLQTEFIEGLARHAGETRIAFDYVLPENRPASDPSEDEYAWKDSSCEELRKRFPDPSGTICLTRAETRPRQFAFQTLDPFAEMQETARRCKEAIAVRGIGAVDILVVARDIDRYGPQAKAAFTQAGLPFFIDESVDAQSLVVVKQVLNLARLALDDFPRRAVIDFLRSKHTAIDAFQFKPFDVDRIDAASIKANVIGGVEQWRYALRDNASAWEKLERWLSSLAPPAVQDPARHARWFEDVLQLHIRPFGEQTRGAASPSEDELQAVRAVRAALRTTIAEAQLFGRNQAISFAQFIARVESLLEQANFRPAQPGADCIYICSAEHAPNRRYDEVFVVGVAEGQFPRHSGESGFVSADERRRWASFGIALANPREEPGFDRALFRSLIERARKSFWASHPRVDMNGEEVVPSFYLVDGTLAHDGVEQVDFIRQSVLQPTAPREAVGGWLWHRREHGVPDRLLSNTEIDHYWQQIAAAVVGACQRHDTLLPSPYNGYLTDLVDQGWLQIKLPANWSASVLMNYAQCPFKYWMNDMLGIKPLAEPEAGLDVQERGSLYHRILELYYRALPAGETTALEMALQQAFRQLESDPEFHPTQWWENEKKQIAFRIKRFIDYDRERTAKSGMRPHLLEAKFGMHDSAYPALTCASAHGPINIRGGIDRIDVELDADGEPCKASVIDYKTGSTGVTADDIAAGVNLQIPIYALAVERCVMPGVKVQSGHYLGINGAKSNGSLKFEQGKHEVILAELEAKIVANVDAIAAGNFLVKPYSSKACKTCDFRSACRIDDLPSPSGGHSHA